MIFSDSCQNFPSKSVEYGEHTPIISDIKENKKIQNLGSTGDDFHRAHNCLQSRMSRMSIQIKAIYSETGNLKEDF